MSVDRVIVDGLARLPQFSHAGVAGDLVFVSGTLGTTDGFSLAEGIAAQTTQTLQNMGTILAETGASWDDVAKVNVLVADMDEFGAMNDAYAAFFAGSVPPARITSGATSLALGARVEMDCVAQRPDRRHDIVSSSPIRRDTGFVDHDGERLYYEDCGPADAPALVLSHGAGGCHAIWFQQVAAFASEYRVITWDHRGYGRSTDLADLSGPAVAVGDLLAILDHLDLEQAALVGQSMGGWTAMGVALARPSLVSHLVLADTLGGIVTDEVMAALAGPAEVVEGRLGAHPALDPEFSSRQAERAHLYQSIGSMGTADPSVIIPRLFETLFTPEQAATIGCPVLCIVGERDPLFPPASIHAVAALIPGATLTQIPGTGHSPYYEAPKAWNAIVGHFLQL